MVKFMLYTFYHSLKKKRTKQRAGMKTGCPGARSKAPSLAWAGAAGQAKQGLPGVARSRQRGGHGPHGARARWQEIKLGLVPPNHKGLNEH